MSRAETGFYPDSRNLAAIRGTDKLLLDLVLCPDQVKVALDQIDRALVQVRKAMSELFAVPKC